ncbi:site-specific integrase [Colwellia sp. UCD-KL20]|uniref:tyrosine-type recombinase/integrase n=1 Tax=Colwellia sp. UCD-KL20 TaxID=1917165 RepID=UPI00097110C3|nr:site-specific integrase [Colwellia sp. UCD-KL20]
MNNQSKPLNSAVINSLKPKDKDLSDIGENRGLRVSCSNAGTKSFFYRYTSPITKKLTQIQIGRFPLVSLAEARVKLKEYKDIKRAERCPAIELKQAKQVVLDNKQKQSEKMTVTDVVELYLRQYIEDRVVNGKKISGARIKKGQSETRRTLYGDAVLVLGNRVADEITRKDIINMIMTIVDRGSNVQAGNVLRELTAAYEYCIGLEKFNDEFANPALLAKNSLRQAKVRLTSKREQRVLSDKELTKFLSWFPGCAFTPTQKNILRFTLWTACRTGEICSAEWEDIDLDKATWHLKATKTEVERYVQLPQQAVDFLKQLKLVTGRYLFPSIKTGLPIQQKSLTEQAWHMRRDERMIDIEHWVPHDLRRTVRTGLSRLGCPSEVAEAALGHARKGIEGTYDLHKYESECKIWLQNWAEYMDRLCR